MLGSQMSLSYSAWVGAPVTTASSRGCRPLVDGALVCSPAASRVTEGASSSVRARASCPAVQSDWCEAGALVLLVVNSPNNSDVQLGCKPLGPKKLHIHLLGPAPCSCVTWNWILNLSEFRLLCL